MFWDNGINGSPLGEGNVLLGITPIPTVWAGDLVGGLTGPPTTTSWPAPDSGVICMPLMIASLMTEVNWITIWPETASVLKSSATAMFPRPPSRRRRSLSGPVFR